MAGKFQAGLLGGVCQSCEFNTYAPAEGMTACIACAANSASGPGSFRCRCIDGYTRANTTADCSLKCDAGFAKSADGSCMALSDESLVLNLEMTLQLSDGGTPDDAAEAIASALSAVHGVPAGHMQVTMNVIPPASRRMLLQASAARYAVEVRVSFPAGTSAADVAAMQSRLGGMDTAQLNDALLNAPGNVRFTVHSIAVAPMLTPAAPLTTPAPLAPTPAPSAPTTTPAATVGPVASMDMILIIAGAGGGVVVLFVAAFCIARQSRHAQGTEMIPLARNA